MWKSVRDAYYPLLLIPILPLFFSPKWKCGVAEHLSTADCQGECDNCFFSCLIYFCDLLLIYTHTHTHSHQLPLAAHCFSLKVSSYSHPPHADLIAHQTAVSTGNASIIQGEAPDLLISSFRLFSFISPVRFASPLRLLWSIQSVSWFRDVVCKASEDNAKATQHRSDKL